MSEVEQTLVGEELSSFVHLEIEKKYRDLLYPLPECNYCKNCKSKENLRAEDTCITTHPVNECKFDMECRTLSARTAKTE